MSQLKIKIKIVQDGKRIDKSDISTYGLKNEDIYYSKRDKVYKTNFVGIVLRGDKILFSIPKHFNKSDNIKEDIHLIMNSITERVYNSQYAQFDPISEVSSNFPIYAYYNIYKYFAQYGLYREERQEIKPNDGNKISWKDTLKRSNKYISDGNLIFTPLFYKKKRNDETIITECMVSIINYTTSLLSNYMTLPSNSKIYNRGINRSIFQNDAIVHRLQEILSKTFKDIDKNLILNIITFLKKANSIKREILEIKCYSFANIWESAVQKYLYDYFYGIDSQGNMIFDKKGPHKHFVKDKSIHYNSIVKYLNWHIEPDHFFKDEKNKIIYLLDSKYYTRIKDINHKQFMYHILYQNQYQDYIIYDSLLMPNEGEDPITEDYINIKDKYLYTTDSNEKSEPNYHITIHLTKLNTAKVLENFVHK